MKYADLHIHTKFSDGTFTPEQVLDQAQAQGLACIAITDHDTVEAIQPGLDYAASKNIELIPGIELTCELAKYEVHLLGYFIDWRCAWFQEQLAQICAVRKQRALTMLQNLRNFQINLDPAELLAQASAGSVGRLHIARLLHKHGYVQTIAEAFYKYIGNNCPAYVKRFKLSPAEAIKMIGRLKGIAVLAHPYSMGNDELIPELIQLGLKGMEVFYPEHNPATSEHYRNLARKYRLLLTGGSDSHGLAKDKKTMGEVKLPYNLVQALKKEAGILPSE